MDKKNKRLLLIGEVINSMKISTQNELLKILVKKGFKVTQATLSRDLKTLKVGKVIDENKRNIFFIQKGNDNLKTEKQGNDNFPVNGFISLKFSNNFGVIHTKAGYASSIASLIDSNSPYDILGTIAGDDTILVIPVEGATSQNIRNALLMIMPELDGRI